MTGKIKFFNEDKGFGFGFIIPDEVGPDVYFHVNDIVDGWPTTDSWVTYDIGQNRRGPCAANVKIR